MAEIYQLKHSGEQIDELLDKADRAVQPIIEEDREYIVADGLIDSNDDTYYHLPNRVTNDPAHTFAMASEVQALQEKKIDKTADDYYPQLSVGTADNLAGVDEVASEFSFRRSGGGAIADGVARVQSIKGNSVVIDGEIVDMRVQGIKSVGRNAFDGNWEQGDISGTTGSEYDSTSTIRTGYIAVIPNLSYYISTQGKTRQLIRARLYDADKNFVGITSASGADICTSEVFTIPANAHYIRFAPSANVIAQSDLLCFNISDTDFNGQYEPYIEDSEDLSIVTKYFPNGMRGVTGAHDEIRYNKSTNRWGKVVRIGEVDMGDKSISLYNAGLNIFYLKIDDIKVATTTGERHTGLLCSRYSMDYDEANPSAVTAMLDKTLMRFSDGRVFLRDSAYTDAASLKASLQGVMLYYELAEPIVTEIEEKDFNLDYKVWNCGSEQMVATEPSAPLAADITYGFNAVGLIKQLRSMIEALSAKVANL